MRAQGLMIAALLFLTGTGCNILRGYIMPGQHFPHGTVTEEQSSKSVLRSAEIMEVVLRNKDFSISNIDKSEESATIRASYEGNQYVVDIKSSGSGSVVHMEIDQAGNETQAWSIMKEFSLYP